MRKQITSLLRTTLLAMLAFSFTGLTAQNSNIKFENSWGKQGVTIKTQDKNGLVINTSIKAYNITETIVDNNAMQTITTGGVLLQNNEGAPNIPSYSNYIAVPQGATVSARIINKQIEQVSNIIIAPAPVIPKDNDTGPLVFKKDEKIYSKNQFYPNDIVTISKPSKIRGMDVVMVAVSPFQYNPVTKELLINRDIEIEITFEGGNGQFGEDRLRNRWWDPIMRDAILNQASIPEVVNNARATTEVGYEYLIIVPDDPIFISWADSLKVFRNRQGISTNVITTTEVGGNTVAAIEGYVNNAYNTWDIPPAAVLLMADYGTSGSTIISPIYDNYCVSDNIFADVDGDHLPDVIFARMTAQNATHLETFVTKVLNYERTPPTNPDFYDHPITALGWQTARWFQICSETVGGYFTNVQGKSPVRINAVYQGNPSSDPWSTAQNTNTILNQFGPLGLGYIPNSPSELGGWTGGSASDVNNAINSGAFILQHRDHGSTNGWGEPNYGSNDINGLTNTDLPFIFSINCLTGKYNMSGECFTEKFHRYTYNGNNSGALGVIAASETSYSFVNDTYVWGMYDNMWPDFLPDYGTTPASRGILPAFGNAAGKYFLQQSSWPYNSNNKEVTYNLFHHHGDAFSVVYSEIPQNLTVIHEPYIMANVTSFDVTADPGSFIALTVNNEIIGTAEGTGSPVTISIPGQMAPDEILVTVTKQNYYRYESYVEVLSTTYVAAGEDADYCESEILQCNGVVILCNSVLWTTSGTGTFDDATIATPVYLPSDEDVIAGSVIHTLTGYGADTTVSDQVTFRIGMMPIVFSGIEDTICANELYLLSDATAENYNSLEWTTMGDGTFDDASLLNATYFLGQNDILSGSVTLKLTAYALIVCEVTDEMTLTIQELPFADAGPNASICENDAYTLSGFALYYQSTVWTTAGDGTFDDTLLLTATYNPGANDISNGSVDLSLTAYSLPPCITEDINTMILSIQFPLTADAGIDANICEDNSYTLSGTASNQQHILWTTSGDGIFDDSTLLSATYTPGSNDLSMGVIELTLTASSDLSCVDDAIDTMILSIYGFPEQPQTPQGPIAIDLGFVQTSEYYVNQVDNVINYQWYLEPMEVGSIVGIDTMSTVSWNPDYLGLSAFVHVIAINDCGEISSDTLGVSVSPVGINTLNNNEPIINISPNPNDGRFTISINGVTDDVDLIIISPNGQIVFQKRLITSQENNIHTMDFSSYVSGIYYLKFISKENIIFRKVMIK